ncbi:serine-rich adhesin for platelets [Drosophila grimshawi]|uniref:serine-rich adhesin for platelets n=1 Tax=Drosophila grimshawi TaxID=7222 RepID=UPI001C93328D|nr:serine-rich adhesin for platelets [Drosophila grimshawi]
MRNVVWQESQTMDDMIFQCSNQNSIYVLNAGYNPTYGDFGATGREMNGSRTTRGSTSNAIGASYSSGACSLQHKFKTFGTVNGNSSATAVAAAAAATAAAAPATLTTPVISTTTATQTTANYANPVATSMSTAMCSPATAALQKLFNCNVGDVGQNDSHRNQLQSHTNNSNNCSVRSLNNSSLSATASYSRCCDPLESATATVAATGAGAGALPLPQPMPLPLPLLGAVANRKKCTNVKSTLIAKKTKFLKFLEEEKWRSSQQLTPDDADACGAIQPQPSRANSNEANPYTASTSTATATLSSTSTSMSAVESSFAGHSASKNNNSNMKNQNNNSNSNSSQEAVGVEQQQNKLNNWSMHNDNNNKLANYTQQQQQLQQSQQKERELYKQTNRSSSYELFQEAADLLGLSCSLCDNCRCLDCQSGYFDCADDDDESYSEQSLMDEYDEYDYGYSYDEQMLLLTSAHPADQSNQPEDSQHEQEELPLCYAVDCQQNCIKVNAARRESESEHRLAIDVDLVNATSSQVLENCVTFNDLSLLDAEQQVEPFT